MPLDAVTKLTQDVGPLSVNHQGQLPAVTISFNLKPGVSLGDALGASTSSLMHTLPADDQHQFSGHGPGFPIVDEGTLLLLIMAILVIYIVLGVLYESFIHPLTILSGLPGSRVRRAFDPASVPYGFEHICLCWSDYACRHCKEERHYDDRFCSERPEERREKPC